MPRVLCVDDDSDLAAIIKVRLQQKQMQVDCASSGSDAYELACSQRPQAIITDLGMPQGDGEFLIRQLKVNADTRDIPILVMSGLQDNIRIDETWALGVAAVLRKPLRFDDLVMKLNKHINGAAKLRRRRSTSAIPASSTGPFDFGTGIIMRLDRRHSVILNPRMIPRTSENE
jgi:DNA-binding response OmpR family regulator